MRSLTRRENVELALQYAREYRKLYAFTTQDPDAVRQFQLEQVRELVAFAYERTAFYRDKYRSAGIHPNDIKTWADFEALPTTCKDEIVEQHDRVIAAGVTNRDPVVSQSSGSSGKRIEVIFDGKFFIRESLRTLRMFQQAFQYGPGDVRSLIYTSEYPFRSIAGFYRTKYINTLTPARQMIEELIATKPVLIVSYPSILLELAKELSDDELRAIRPRAIATNSEYSSQHQRDYITSLFGCPVFDEYSSEELSRIAFQCGEQKYHVQEDCSYIELLSFSDDSKIATGESGELTGTCFLNWTMPFIRYRQGDAAVLPGGTCSCGLTGRLLSNVGGRRNNRFILANGRSIPTGRLLDWTYQLVLKYSLPFLQFELVQTSITDVTFDVVPQSGFDLQHANDVVRQSFRENFGNELSISVRIVGATSKTPVGKHLPIRSLVKEPTGR